MNEHKHAEVLRAIADGKAVECYEWREQSWGSPLLRGTNPISDPDLEWRIKPEPKPPIVREIGIQLDSGGYIMGLTEPNIRFTFDPDTKLPIKVELI